MSARPPKTPPESPPPVLLWGGAGMVAVVVHLMVVQQGLAAMGNLRAAVPPELPFIEVMAVASTVQGQDQPIENARPVTSEALRPQTAADRLAAASPSAERAQTAQTAAAVAARPVAPSAAPVPRLAAPIPAAPTPAAPAVAPSAAATAPQSATQPDAAERLAALVAPASPLAPAPSSAQAWPWGPTRSRKRMREGTGCFDRKAAGGVHPAFGTAWGGGVNPALRWLQIRSRHTLRTDHHRLHASSSTATASSILSTSALKLPPNTESLP